MSQTQARTPFQPLHNAQEPLLQATKDSLKKKSLKPSSPSSHSTQTPENIALEVEKNGTIQARKKKDGTLDMRYKENREAYNEPGKNLDKSLDKRFKENKVKEAEEKLARKLEGLCSELDSMDLSDAREVKDKEGMRSVGTQTDFKEDEKEGEVVNGKRTIGTQTDFS